ncbi:hypothetical protein Cni_G10029 [Canna indica]|uniref:Methyltransferase type 11 domain-containing protein n=1 Tax=Canna indica TaxID=4628 RepID=A0AAQ3K5X6_9LILI|nr:hypothetical protein Cni_G10029 [Canna indica]
MGSIEEQPKRSILTRNSICSKLKILLLVVSTNLLSLFLFSCTFDPKWSTCGPRIHAWNSAALLHELNATRSDLSGSRTLAADLQRRLAVTNSLLQTLLAEVSRAREDDVAAADELSGELKLAMGPHKLPLGFTSNLDTDELYPALGAGCFKFQDELVEYMSYEVGEECPSDDIFAQRLMLKGCEPLPRRRCHPRSPAGYIEPTPFPVSLWTTPPDTSITWDAYTCKNYTCLINRNKEKKSYDCKDCFDLNGREKTRWLLDDAGGLSYGIDAVLASKPRGTIRIGLDIGGGSGTFAARMRERKVTIVTSTMNFDGPFNSFIAGRGLVPLHISIAHRLPFFDGTLDIVHSMHVLCNWIPDVVLEFALYDIYRVLRPGGLFWLDHFFCTGAQLNATYVPMLEGVGFKKLRWTTGRKLDRGVEKDEWYLSALLEKPMT